MPAMLRGSIDHNMDRHTMRAAITLALVAQLVRALPFAAPAAAAEPAEAPNPARSLELALNTLAPVEKGCRLSFVVRNGMAAEIEALSLEIAVFGAGGGLENMVRLNFGVLIDGKTRVRQFDLSDTPCEAIGSVLVNDVAACSGEGIEPLDCLRAMTLKAGGGVPFLL